MNWFKRKKRYISIYITITQHTTILCNRKELRVEENQDINEAALRFARFYCNRKEQIYNPLFTKYQIYLTND